MGVKTIIYNTTTTLPITISKGDNAGLLIVAASGSGITGNLPGIYSIARTTSTDVAASAISSATYVESVKYNHTDLTISFNSIISRATAIWISLVG